MQTMNYKEAARYLKITAGTLRNWVSQGRIKPRKVGKHAIFFKEELETWIKNPTPANPEPAMKDLVDVFADCFQPPEKQKPQPVTPPAAKPGKPTEWVPQFHITTSDQEKDPYALLPDLPGPNVKMTPDNMRELARYLVDAAALCEKRQYRGLKNFPVFRENDRFKSSVVLVPFNQMHDLHTLALAALRSGDVLAETKEKYVIRFIHEGLKHQLPLVNMQLKKNGMRAISFKSLKK
ncbi:MAG: helix-turn-helix domain-containing protein [Candidatus Riflebacteria bacterium]|nr:helix-turn-helix domain-containing protein [Candidatus Riflebacteria bacterium]